MIIVNKILEKIKSVCEKYLDKNKIKDSIGNITIEDNTLKIKKQIEKYIDEFLSLEKPTRELIINLAHKIYIYQDKRVDIIFTFKNVT